MADKRLLIDATNLSGGGGGTLLRTLLDRLPVDQSHAIASINTKSSLAVTDGQRPNVTFVPASQPFSFRRRKLISEAVEEHTPKRLLCFGNIPPTHRIGAVDVVTYFQNAHLLASLDCRVRYGIKDRLRFGMLRKGIKSHAGKTDWWVTQTRSISHALQSELGSKPDSIVCYPFYDVEGIQRAVDDAPTGNKEPKTFVYVSDGRPHKNHARLLEAWGLVSAKHTDATLALTIHPPRHAAVSSQSSSLRFLGPVSWHEGIQLAKRCEYLIFPSLLETVGLGVIEGVMAGAKPIVPHDSYFQDIVDPFLTFDAMSVRSIASVIDEAISVKDVQSNKSHSDWSLSNATIALPNLLDEFAEWLLR